MNTMYMVMRLYGIPITKQRTCERNIVICMLIADVTGAIIKLFFAELANKNNKFVHRSTDEITA